MGSMARGKGTTASSAAAQGGKGLIGLQKPQHNLSSIWCFRCQEMGHIAVHCLNFAGVNLVQYQASVYLGKDRD